jgi:DHA2 family multidrug resistance protein-like MFS transporter
MGAATVALLFGRFPVHGTTITLVVAACAAAGAAVVSFLRLVEREQTVP